MLSRDPKIPPYVKNPPPPPPAPPTCEALGCGRPEGSTACEHSLLPAPLLLLRPSPTIGAGLTYLLSPSPAGNSTLLRVRVCVEINSAELLMWDRVGGYYCVPRCFGCAGKTLFFHLLYFFQNFTFFLFLFKLLSFHDFTLKTIFFFPPLFFLSIQAGVSSRVYSGKYVSTNNWNLIYHLRFIKNLLLLSIIKLFKFIRATKKGSPSLSLSLSYSLPRQDGAINKAAGYAGQRITKQHPVGTKHVFVILT